MAKKNARNRSPKKRWAFLIYIAGDNNLSDAGLEDIQELCEEGSSESVYVGVEIDTYGEHTGSIRYEITEPDWTGFAHRTVIERLPEKDSGDPDTLLSFLKWGLNRYNADN
ncbi:MAG: clostripain-related cysteine peptidase, partial [Thermodesulfobacteriota bacterium]